MLLFSIYKSTLQQGAFLFSKFSTVVKNSYNGFLYNILKNSYNSYDCFVIYSLPCLARFCGSARLGLVMCSGVALCAFSFGFGRGACLACFGRVFWLVLLWVVLLLLCLLLCLFWAFLRAWCVFAFLFWCFVCLFRTI